MFSAGGELRPGRAQARQLREPRSDAPYPVDWIDGCCMLLRRTVVDAVGLFDERYFIYFEEVDYCVRVTRAGWRIVVEPSARAWQEKPALPRLNTFYLLSRNRYLFWREHFGAGFVRVAASLAWETARLAGWGVKSLLRPGLWGECLPRFRRLDRQVRGAVLGTRDHLRGRYGPNPALLGAGEAGTQPPAA